MRRILLGLLIVLLTASPLAGAYDCEASTPRRPEVDTCVTGLIPGCVYVDVDPCYGECMPLVWVYQESNGIPGLQRGDEVVDDTCHGAIEPDTIIF